MFIKSTPVFFEEVTQFSDNAVRDSGGFGSIGKCIYFLAEKKKVITQTEQTIDFSLATIEEKKNLIKLLFINQKELVILTINYLNPSLEVLIYFMFIVALWESVFGFLHHHIPNQIIDSDFFFKFLCCKVG